jgi:2-acylglycerol O-acyltransferase 2
MCAAVNKPDDLEVVPTAAASVVLKTPLLKNLMGVFNLIDASASSLKNRLKTAGSVLMYIGGIAELFKSSRREERLYLAKRKGFIKLALREGTDVVPVYLFGNTSVLSVLKKGPLATLSRKLQASLTVFWGKWYLPIPRDEKMLYVVGKPLGMPHIMDPTQEDIDKWHGVYCEEVKNIFETYKEKVPMYKHKKLFID